MDLTRARDLHGKVAVVTGGSRGIGRAIVLGAVARGAKVAFCARELGTAAAEVVREAEARAGPGCVLAVRADVSVEADVEELFDKTLARFGQVDIAVNNAGKNLDDLLITMEVSDFDEVMAVNLTGAFLVCRRAVQEFLAAGEGGRIVSVGSLSDHGATSQASYAASKGALWGLTRSIAKEYGHKGIAANLVVVGFVETDMSARVPEVAKRFLIDHCTLRRAAAPDEIADAVLFLASKRATYVNGESLHASGGLLDIPL